MARAPAGGFRLRPMIPSTLAKARVIAALNRAQGYFRRELGRELALRFVPRIRFAADTSFEYSSRIDALLHQPDVERDLAADAGADSDADSGAGLGQGGGDHGS